MSSRRILIRDEPKISLWAHGDTLQVAGYIVGAPGLGQGRREHVLRHHLHHALSYSVAEEQRCVRLLQHCLTRSVLAVNPAHESLMAELDYVFSYLFENQDMGIRFTPEDGVLRGTADASWEVRASTLSSLVYSSVSVWS